MVSLFVCDVVLPVQIKILFFSLSQLEIQFSRLLFLCNRINDRTLIFSFMRMQIAVACQIELNMLKRISNYCETRNKLLKIISSAHCLLTA